FTFTPGCEPPPPLTAPSSQLAVGYQHSCALRADTTVKCWGYNASGQLGDGTNTDSNIAVTVAGITGATAITAGFEEAEQWHRVWAVKMNKPLDDLIKRGSSGPKDREFGGN
ncbi:MAG: RCC1 domain-containing protein, partial [Verrucomicrobiota bacterium]